MTIQCRSCSREFELPVTDAQLKAWKEGMLIQRAMPHLRPDQRELLKTAICGECFNRIFGLITVSE